MIKVPDSDLVALESHNINIHWHMYVSPPLSLMMASLPPRSQTFPRRTKIPYRSLPTPLPLGPLPPIPQANNTEPPYKSFQTKRPKLPDPPSGSGLRTTVEIPKETLLSSTSSPRTAGITPRHPSPLCRTASLPVLTARRLPEPPMPNSARSPVGFGRPLPSPQSPSPQFPSFAFENAHQLTTNFRPSPYSSFDPILLSQVKGPFADSSKLIVTLETSTKTYLTTSKTLTSRPSYLSEYLRCLISSSLPISDRAPEAPIYSRSNETRDTFDSIIDNQTTPSGLLAQPISHITIFLDRPSAPYDHILTYLRAASSPDHAAALPKAVKLSVNAPPSRIDALLELCDEADFLRLEELHKLCAGELHFHRQNQLEHLIRDGSMRSSNPSTRTRAASDVSSASHGRRQFGDIKEQPVDASATPPPYSTLKAAVHRSSSSYSVGSEYKRESPSTSQSHLYNLPTTNIFETDASRSSSPSSVGSEYERETSSLSQSHFNKLPTSAIVKIKNGNHPQTWI